jgi:hypothetical protein
MPLHGCHQQREASIYFDIDAMNKRKQHKEIPENIMILEKIIEKTKEDIAFVNDLYEFSEDFDYTYNEYIVTEYIPYDIAMNDATLLVNSEYYIFHMDGYYIKTAEGNHRNWVYVAEINDEYERLLKYLEELEAKMREKVVNIGLEIALLVKV